MKVLLIGLCWWLLLSQPAWADSVSIRMYFFYTQDCRDCQAIKNDLIPALNEKYDSALKVKYFEINEPENYELMSKLERRYNYKLKNPPPTIFIDGHVLDGAKEIRKRFKRIVRECYLKGGCPWPDEDKVKSKVEDEILFIEKFKSLGILTIISGGLLDGVNPCALTTLIFFISYLAFIGRKGREIIFVGISFTSAIFIVYLLVGMGLFEFIRKIAIFPLVSQVMTLLVALGAAMLGILSLYDYSQIREGKIEGIKLQLPEMIKKLIRRVIERGTGMKHYILGAFIIGLLVSILEFSCTGQIYLPIILVLRHIVEMRIQAFFYLVLYNLMFVLPLIIVFILTYYGVTSERLARIIQRHIGKVKLCTAILFFGIAGILILFS